MHRGDVALVLPLAAALALAGCGLDLAAHRFGDNVTVTRPISRVDVRETTGPAGSIVVRAFRSGDHHQR
jgi:hypothetical protein